MPGGGIESRRGSWVVGAVFAGLAAAVLGGALGGCNKLAVGPFRERGGSAQSRARIAARPHIELTQPRPGAFLAAGRALVSGRTAPRTVSGTAIQSVHVNGQPATLFPDGRFEAFVSLESGINPIVAVVTDADGVTNNTSLAVMAGDYSPLDRPIRDAAVLRLNDWALPAIAAILEDVIWTVDLQQLTVAPILDTTLGWIHAWVDVLNARYFDVRVGLDLEPDGLYVRIELFDVVVDMEATLDLGLGVIAGPEAASARADKMLLTGRLVLGLRPDHRLRLDIVDPQLRFEGFRIDFQSGLIQLIEAVLRDATQRELGRFVAREIAKAQPAIDQALLDVFTPSQPYPVFGRPFTYDLRGESVDYDANGMSVRFRFNAPPVQPIPAARRAPGSLHTPGGLPPIAVAQGIFVCADDDAINRLLHGAWAGGLLQYDLSAAALPIPGTTLSPTGGLTAFDLMQFLPELQGQVSRQAPISLRVHAELPPVIKVRGSPDPVELQLGEVILDVLIDRGQGPELLASIAMSGSLSANAGMSASGLWLTSARNAEFYFDVRAMPITPLDTRRVQVVLGTAIAPLLPRLINQVPVIPIPHLGQLSFVNVQVFPDGPEREHLSISADLQR